MKKSVSSVDTFVLRSVFACPRPWLWQKDDSQQGDMKERVGIKRPSARRMRRSCTSRWSRLGGSTSSVSLLSRRASPGLGSPGLCFVFCLDRPAVSAGRGVRCVSLRDSGRFLPPSIHILHAPSQNTANLQFSVRHLTALLSLSVSLSLCAAN